LNGSETRSVTLRKHKFQVSGKKKSKKTFWPKANDVNTLGYYVQENPVTYIKHLLLFWL